MNISGVGGGYSYTTPAASAGKAASATSPAEIIKPDAEQEFLDYMKKTPEERLQEAWLKKHGLTKEDFDKMSPEKKQMIVEKMKQDIIEEMHQKMANQTRKPLNIIA